MIKGNKTILKAATQQIASVYTIGVFNQKRPNPIADRRIILKKRLRLFKSFTKIIMRNIILMEPDQRRPGFIIMNDQEAVGFISYSAFHLKPHSAELDIWMKDEANCGKGFGMMQFQP